MRNIPSRLIMWLIITVLLVCALVIGIYGFSPQSSPRVASAGFSTGFSYDDPETYATGDRDIVLDDITSLKVSWVSGSVQVLPYDGDEVKIHESAARPLEEHEMLRYRVKGGTLSVQFCESRKGFMFLNMPEKHLTIWLPDTIALDSIDIENVSSAITLDGGGKAAREIDIESVSGNVTVRDWIADELSLENVSGKMDIHGEFGKIDAESVSGRQAYQLPTTPDLMDIESISGEIVVEMTESRGFRASLDSISGRIQTDFADNTDRKTVLFGDGDASLQFETVSGGVELRNDKTLSRVSPVHPTQAATPKQKATPAPTAQPKSTAPVPSSQRGF